MSRPARRTLSCLFVLAIIVIAVIGWTYLPGSGGVVEELRWLLARDSVPPQHFNRAAGLMLFAEKRTPGARCALFTELLRDKHSNVVPNTLTLLADQLRYLYGQRQSPLRVYKPLWSTFDQWFTSLDEDKRRAHRTGILGVLQILYNEHDFLEQDRYRRFLLCATLSRNPQDRNVGLYLLFGGPVSWWETGNRLAVLDGLRPPVPNGNGDDWKPDPAQWPPWPDPRTPDGFYLDHPTNEVRWATGRILAVHRDKRGLPAVYEWLQHNPKACDSADKVLTELFGPDWRKPFESGSAASQPGAGDGGG